MVDVILIAGVLLVPTLFAIALGAGALRTHRSHPYAQPAAGAAHASLAGQPSLPDTSASARSASLVAAPGPLPRLSKSQRRFGLRSSTDR